MNFRMVWMGPDDPGRPPKRIKRRGEAFGTGSRYDRRGGELVRIERRANGTIRSIPIANFSARIVADLVLDDGLEERREVAIEAEVDGKMIHVTLSATEFGKMNWVLRELGPRAIVYPGQQQHVRAAIQSLSDTIRQERIFAHLGWRKHQGNWAYLQSAGALGAGGLLRNVQVQIADPLKNYEVGLPRSATGIKDSLGFVFEFLSVAPDRITIPLLAAVYRAPLGPVDFSLFLTGRTGTFKTALAALCQQYFGARMNAAHLPANFASTPSAIEEIAFQAKDSLLVIDDFVPTGRMTDGSLQALAERIFRAAGNRQGRSRMNGQRLRPPRPPRALLLATGEEVPNGHSLRSRMLIVETKPGDVDRAALTRCQIHADQAHFAAAMAGYLNWMASRYEQLQRRALVQLSSPLGQAIINRGHARLPDMIAELVSGWEIFLDFATEAAAISRDERTDLQKRASLAFEEIASVQAHYHQASDPALRFRSLLRTAIASGIAHVADRSGSAPESAEHWGWRKQQANFLPEGERIGWIVGTEVFLEPAVSYQIAQALAGHERIPISAQTLRHRLQEHGLIESVDGGRRMLLVRRILDGCSREVLHLRARDFLEMAERNGPAR